MNDPVGGILGGEVEDLLPAGHQPRRELIPPVGVLDEEQGEIGSEALAQPDVVPVGFSDGVPEPLMGDLVDHHVPPPHRAGPRYALLGIKDARGRFHPAGHAVRLDVGQLLVRVRPDPFAVERQHVAGRDCKVVETVVPLFGEDPGVDRDPVILADSLHRERRYPQRVEPRRDRNRLPPDRPAGSVRKVTLLHLEPVGHDLVVSRRRDHEFDRALVGNVVDRRQPVPHFVGPVVAEEGPPPVPVGLDEQAGDRNAVVLHRHGDSLSRGRWRREPDTQAVGAMLERRRSVVDGHGCYRHAATRMRRRGLHQVEFKAGEACGEQLDLDRGATVDRVGRVAQRQFKAIVLDVERLARIGVAEERCREKRRAKADRHVIPWPR